MKAKPKNYAKPQPPGSFGHELRKRREAIGLDRKEFANKTGISYSRLSTLEYNFKVETIMLETAIKISELLHWDLKKIANRVRPSIKWNLKCHKGTTMITSTSFSG